MLRRLNILGTPATGIHACATDRYCLVPGRIKEKVVEIMKDVLQIPCMRLNISIQKLLGVMLVGNSNGLILPNHLPPNDERNIMKAMEEFTDVDVHVLEESKLNALGNLIATNDRGTIVSRKVPDNALGPISDCLGTEVVKMPFSNFKLVGTRVVSNKLGCLVSPLATDEEARSLKDIFKVDVVDFTTVCLGIEAIRIGIISNSNGALVGDTTSGPELARISEVLSI
ncbi:translation initiation factor IF-6 [Candidatus Bathyarchaeota archaeon]|nr:translation initiation factor IF-6 [Candidatus Bathyarchaeota archaeon]